MSLRITQNAFFTSALQNIQRANSKNLSLQNQISTGLRVLRPSDDPVAAVRILPLRAEINGLDTSSDLLTNASQKLDAATAALQDGSSTLQRLREVALLAANSTVSATDRQNMAAEIDQLLQQMLSAANSQHDQRFFFGGAKSGSPPFELVTVNGRQTVAYRGGGDVSILQGPQGEPTALGLAGDEIFLARNRQATTFEGTTGAAASGAADSGIGFGTLDVTFAGLDIPAGTTGLAQGDSSTTALGPISYTFAAGSPPTLSLDGGPPQAINGGVQNFNVGTNGQTVSLDVTVPVSPTTGTFESEAFLSTDGGTTQLRVTDFSSQYQVRNALDGTVLNVDVSAMDRIGSETVTFNGTFDVFTSLIAVADLLKNPNGLPDDVVQTRLTNLLGEIDFGHESMLGALQELGDRSGNMQLMKNRLDQVKLARQQSLSQLEDADLAETILELNRQDIGFQASLQLAGRASQTSLLNFLR